MPLPLTMGMKGIGFEIDKEYFDAGKNRIDRLPPRQETLFDQLPP